MNYTSLKSALPGMLSDPEQISFTGYPATKSHPPTCQCNYIETEGIADTYQNREMQKLFYVSKIRFFLHVVHAYGDA